MEVSEREVTARGFRDALEGPKSLRYLCMIGGGCWIGFGVLGIINIFKIIFSPIQFVTEFYMILFGIAVVVVELKGLGERLEFIRKCQDWFLRWMPFLSVMMGKGVFYLVGGGLGLSLWLDNIFIFGTSVYMSLLGLLLCFLHCGKCGTAATQFNIVQDLEQERTASAQSHNFPFQNGAGIGSGQVLQNLQQQAAAATAGQWGRDRGFEYGQWDG